MSRIRANRTDSRLSRGGRRTVLRVAIAAVTVGVLGSGLLSASPAGAAATASGQTGRVCPSYYTGDDVREMSVCVSVWWSGTGTYRGVVDMHTYKVASGTHTRLGDSVSQSITLNKATLYGFAPLKDFGIENGAATCRLGSPSGPPSSCSTPNAAAVSYYGVGYDGSGPIYACVSKFSWRDDRGVAHTISYDPARILGICSPDAP